MCGLKKMINAQNYAIRVRGWKMYDMWQLYECNEKLRSLMG